MRRVLAIDGGGIKGVFAAAFLARIEDHIEGSVGDYFDLICGTSTGGILALGLASGLSAQDILGFYQKHAQDIFGPAPSHWRAIRRLWRPKFDSAPLHRALREHFGDRRLRDCNRRLVVPSQVLETGDVHIYKTPHHPRLVDDVDRTLVDVAMATAAAPTYFAAHRPAGCALLVDGGTWSNNPAGVAATEAVGVLGWDRKETRLLSVGCTEEPWDPTRVRNTTFEGAAWLQHAHTLMMKGQSFGALGTAKSLLGAENVHRISAVVAPNRFTLDDASTVDDLVDLGRVEARTAISQVRERFFDTPAEPLLSLPSPPRSTPPGATEMEGARWSGTS